MQIPKLLISAERYDLSVRENMQRDAELRDLLEAGPFAFKEVLGSVDGTTEISYVIALPTRREHRGPLLAQLHEMAMTFEQQSTIMIELDGSVWEHRYLGNVDRLLGKWVAHGPTPPSDRDWTLDLETLTYWTIEGS